MLKSACCRRPLMPRPRRTNAPHRPQSALAAIPVANPAFSELECAASQIRNKFPPSGLLDHLEVSP
jgi:hypothetical protein